MSKRKISVVITDLDNTLYDWFDVWSKSFNAMLESLVAQSGIPRQTLIAEIKAIHEKHGTAEYAFLIQEIPSLQAKHPNEDLTGIYAPAINAYKQQRDAHLRLYPHVIETLKTLKERGCLIVGYTESQLFYSEYRIHALGLDGILDSFYSPPSHDFPSNLPPEQVNFYPTGSEKLKYTSHRATPKDKVKPNAEVLLGIAEEIGAEKERVIYIGDNRIKDISMAQQAGVTDVYAAYGDTDKDDVRYQLLRQVTHWKAAAVEKENTEGAVIPTYTLKNSLMELLTQFDFVPFSGKGADMSDERIGNYIELWKKTVDVQQHFNDLELRIRNFAITVLGAVLSIMALSLKEQINVTIFGSTMRLAALLVFVALVTWFAFFLMDRLWYHRLLIGAVEHGQKIEQRMKDVLPDIDLAHSIGAASPIKIRGREILNSSKKMNLFYGLIAAVLLGLLYALYSVPTPTPQEKPRPDIVINNIMPATPGSNDNNSNAAERRPSGDNINAPAGALNSNGNAGQNSNQ